jgi:hypothetical protein
VKELLGNKIIIIPLFSGFLTQFLKFLINWARAGKPDFRWLFLTGGMPSAHAASVMSLSTLVGLYTGFSSVLFGVTLFFSLIVMYDAAGLRRAAGMQASIINKIIDELQIEHRIKEERLRELLGHTPFEVLVGASIGILLALIFK